MWLWLGEMVLHQTDLLRKSIDSQFSILIYLVHVGNYVVLSLQVGLVYAVLVDPGVSESQPHGNLHRVLDNKWYTLLKATSQVSRRGRSETPTPSAFST